MLFVANTMPEVKSEASSHDTKPNVTVSLTSGRSFIRRFIPVTLAASRHEAPFKLSASLKSSGGARKAAQVKPATAKDCALREALLKRLHELLQCLSHDRRRSVLLRNLSQSQRLALEDWIVARRAEPHTWQSSLSTGGRILRPLQLKAESQQQLKRKLLTREVRVAKVFRQQAKYCYYYAHASFAGLELLTRTDSDFETICSFQRALVAIQRRVAVGSSLDFEALFREAVAATLTELNLDAAAMGLRFKVIVRPLWTETNLRTRAYSVPSELEAGLCAWRRLIDARGQQVCRGRNCALRGSSPCDLELAWIHLRQEYVGVMIEAGCRQGPLMMRLHSLEKQRALRQEQQVERWNQAQMRREEQQQRRAALQGPSRDSHTIARRAAVGEIACNDSVHIRVENTIVRLLRRWSRVETQRASFRPQVITLRKHVSATKRCRRMARQYFD